MEETSEEISAIKKHKNVIMFCNHIFGGSVDIVILRHLLKDPGSLMI